MKRPTNASPTLVLARAIGLATALFAGVAGGLACRGEPSVQGCPSAQPQEKPIDERVMAFLSGARALHHEADMKERAGDVTGAMSPLQRLVAMPSPGGNEADEVLADTHARLAELQMRAGDLDAAQASVGAGLQHVQGATYFRGHLLEVEGLVEEARSLRLADAGRADAAAAARARALGLLEEAVHVQEGVIDTVLPGEGGTR
jgi:hypothetical protein